MSSLEDPTGLVGSFGGRRSFRQAGPRPYSALKIITRTLNCAWKQTSRQCHRLNKGATCLVFFANDHASAQDGRWVSATIQHVFIQRMGLETGNMCFEHVYDMAGSQTHPCNELLQDLDFQCTWSQASKQAGLDVLLWISLFKRPLSAFSAAPLCILGTWSFRYWAY